MARMLGKAAWDGLFCHCCNDRRSHHHQRQREAHAWRREALAGLDERHDIEGEA